MSAVLEIRNLSKRFGGVVVADEISLDISKGEILGLVGPNGAGKTSLFNLISGTINPDAGSITVEGTEIVRRSPPARARLGVARTWQHIRLFPSLTVTENLLIAPRDFPDETFFSGFRLGQRQRRELVRERALGMLERIGLGAQRNAYPGELSYGRQKLVSIARALMNEGPLLLLVEPMAGVEGPAYERIQSIVVEAAASGKAVCVIEHNISFLKGLCNRAVFMFNGKILARGSMQDLMQDKLMTDLYFGR